MLLEFLRQHIPQNQQGSEKATWICLVVCTSACQAHVLELSTTPYYGVEIEATRTWFLARLPKDHWQKKETFGNLLFSYVCISTSGGVYCF